MSLTLRRTPATTRSYTEVLEGLGKAIPLQMLLIPAGSFLMGLPAGEPSRHGDEEPQHKVTLSSFFMGRYPITQAQWQRVATLPIVERDLKTTPSYFKGDNHPVECVSWPDAMEFCHRLSTQTKRPYRLPSEAEWEYACRAGTTTPFHFGRNLTTGAANYNGNYIYADGDKGENREQTTPVDQFNVANAFGLSEMHGNVWEWCKDRWHENYQGAPTDGSAWLTNKSTAFHVQRGGSWYNNPRYCRAACRNYATLDSADFIVGFRLCCDAPKG